MRLETGNACCVCHGTHATLWRMAHDNLLGGDALYQAVRCEICGTVRLDPRPDDMGKFYAPTTYARAEEGQSEIGIRLDAYAARAAALVGSLPAESDAPRRALDIGCGDGRFLLALKQKGWDVEGTETDPVAAELASRRLGIRVHGGMLEELSLDSASFDCISLLHVLEHLPDPESSLAACRRLLKTNGTILLHLPNVAGMEAKTFGASWYHLDLPRHFWGFTPGSLRRLLHDSGFTDVHFRFLPFLFAPQSVRNALRRTPLQTGNSAARGGGGRGQTRLFLGMLAVSSVVGRILPGEIMIVTARASGDVP